MLSRRAKGAEDSPRSASGTASEEDDVVLLPRSTNSSPVLTSSPGEARGREARSSGSGGGGGGGGGGGRALGSARACLRLTAWAAAGALVLFVLLLGRTGSQGPAPQSWVKVEGAQFSLDCRPFYLAGFNVDNIGQAAIPSISRKLQSPGGGRKLVRSVFRQAAAAGMNVVRTFAHTTDPQHPLQVKPGEYSEDVWRGLDVVIAEAGAAGLRVVLSLVDNWKYHGGVDEFVDWSSSVPPRDPRFPPINKHGDVSVEDYSPERLAYENKRKAMFFTDQGARGLYKAHMRVVLERRNSVTGRVYRDDPTLLAFNLINEPRCPATETPDCPDLFQRWVHDMALHFKSLDQSHLLTVGEEGFWGERDAMNAINPGAPGSDWAVKAGQDFVANHQLPTIDFASVHLWPDNWNTHNTSFHLLWLDKHTEDGDVMLKKPVVVEEFGRALGRGGNPPPHILAQHRDPLYAAVYSQVEAGVGRGRSMAGSMYWRWGLNVYDNDVPGRYGVLPEHSTFQLIAQHAQRMKAHMNTLPPRQECQLDCWVAVESLFGLLRRCEHRPSVCAEQRARRQYQKPFNDASGRLQPQGREVFASQADCCRPGLGGHAAGCSTTWV